MKEVKVQLFKFNELEGKVQKKILKEEIQSQFEFYCETFLYEELEELAKEELNSIFNKVTNIRLLYDFSYSQGSGLLVEFDGIYKNINFEVRQNPHNSLYTYCENFVINYEDEENVSINIDKELREKITHINCKLKSVGYAKIEDDEYFESQAEDYLLQLDEEFTKDGKYFDN